MEKEYYLKAWVALARAVVFQAGQDYVALCRQRPPGKESTLLELEEFFLSSQIPVLSGVDGKEFLEKLKRRISANGP